MVLMYTTPEPSARMWKVLTTAGNKNAEFDEHKDHAI
jgi:hypothetical protein